MRNRRFFSRIRLRTPTLGYGLVAVLLTIALAAGDAQLRQTSIVQKFTQPATVTYDDRSVHYIGLLQVRTWILRRDLPYRIHAGRDPSLSSGHSVEIAMTGTDRPTIRTVTWTLDGARIVFETGHEIFIPAGRFTDGR
ncbi:hypothetical protein JK358_37590 [Nocardia sp. 2]|uniref:Uncharacterized protein n=1 Tax=Nocardia acididurans TaxID=2802282 RepID=A0ABS1MLC7_9NOCA|nr:hypothetical protein [Nocardia acididurans]MBL1080123.1 hypothetical protein [Nocardia acididurans]